MTAIIRLFTLAISIFPFCHVYGQNTSDTLSLSQTTQWRALLHINSESGNGEIESYVDDSSFFIATDGATNPESELIATIEALKSQNEIQCKFPARTAFLKDNISELSKQIPFWNCQEYTQWRSRLNTSSVVLVFASAQLNSPSSMYGHTFLRFDPEHVDRDSTYLSYALNFGATVPDNENGFLYAAKGLTGGYPGNFAANPYFEKIKEYSRLENRDLWEYKLNLSSSEIDTMLAHIWELQGVNFAYYFFDENCSFRLLELLDVARPGVDLAKQFPVTAMPLDTVRVVKNASLISETHYRPSILTELEAQLAILSKEERKLVLALAQNADFLNADFLNDERFVSLPSEKQQLIVDSAYRYLRYQNTFNGRKADITRRSFELLRHLNKNPTNFDIAIKTPQSPEQGHKTTMVSMSGGVNDDQNFVALKYRGSYHDLLDPLAGYYSGMSLNMVNISLRLYEDNSVKIEKAELLDIFSLSERNEFLSPWSWKANISLEQQWTDGKEVLVTQGTAGRGISYRPLNNSYLFLMATGRLELNRKLDTYATIAPGLHAGFLYNWPKTTLLLDAEHYQFLFDQTQRSRVSIQQSLQLSNNNSVRLSADFHKVSSKTHVDKSYNEIKLEYRHYF
jgi:hypothetical protein